MRMYKISRRGQPTKGGPPVWDLDEVLEISTVNHYTVTKYLGRPQTWADPLV